jgi:hypothetical protein
MVSLSQANYARALREEALLLRRFALGADLIRLLTQANIE